MPAAFETVAHKTAVDIDAALTQDELPEDLLKTTLDLHREVTMDHLVSIRGSATIDIAKWRWPKSLFIPWTARARCGPSSSSSRGWRRATSRCGADITLAAWQPLPGGGFDLLGFKVIDVATSTRQDQSHGQLMKHFARSFDGPDLSAQFVVQAGRTYLLGVVGRISVTSTLTESDGDPLPALSASEFRAWGEMNCRIPQINVLTKRIDIP